MYHLAQKGADRNKSESVYVLGCYRFTLIHLFLYLKSDLGPVFGGYMVN